MARATVAQKIMNLSFRPVIDEMLVGGEVVAQVAAFIHEQGGLTDVPRRTVENVLRERKKELNNPVVEIVDNDDDDWFGDTADHNGPQMVSALSRAAKSRIDGGIEEVIELEALYLAQRDRLDRMIALECEMNAFSDKLGREMNIASDLLIKRLLAKEKAGIGSKSRDIKDLKGYSKDTAEVLSRPNSRRRVISIVERLARMETDSVRAITASTKTSEEASEEPG